MISRETLENLAKQHQSSLFPNILREYFQHVFLKELYKLEESEKLQFKGGTAFRIIYGSPRFSEDLDFSLFGVPSHQAQALVESLFVRVLGEIEKLGIKVEMGKKSGATTGGYWGVATFRNADYGAVDVEINVSNRKGKTVKGEVDTVANDFVPAYSVVHLPQEELVEEKIFGALMERKKPRDFYDLYFMMRKGMLSADHKKRFAKIRETVIGAAAKINFRGELGKFLPADQQMIIRDFPRALEAEMKRQIGSA